MAVCSAGTGIITCLRAKPAMGVRCMDLLRIHMHCRRSDKGCDKGSAFLPTERLLSTFATLNRLSVVRVRKPLRMVVQDMLS